MVSCNGRFSIFGPIASSKLGIWNYGKFEKPLHQHYLLGHQTFICGSLPKEGRVIFELDNPNNCKKDFFLPTERGWQFKLHPSPTPSTYNKPWPDHINDLRKLWLGWFLEQALQILLPKTAAILYLLFTWWRSGCLRSKFIG